MKTATLTITRGDRPQLLKNCKRLIARQTMQPDFQIFVDYPPRSNAKDITERFKQGIKEAKKLGVSWVWVIEDDDYYSPLYLESMYYPKLDAVGYGETIYYHIRHKAYKKLNHHVRGQKQPYSSLFCTAFNIKIFDNFNWPPDDYVFLDFDLWVRHIVPNYNYLLLNNPVDCLGIKHGIGLSGGSGHSNLSYPDKDKDLRFLSAYVDAKTLEFYKTL